MKETILVTIKSANESAAAFYDDKDAWEDRCQFVANLGALLVQTREGIERCYLEGVHGEREDVHVCFRGGHEELVNIRCDSYMAIIRDVVKSIEL